MPIIDKLAADLGDNRTPITLNRPQSLLILQHSVFSPLFNPSLLLMVTMPFINFTSQLLKSIALTLSIISDNWVHVLLRPHSLKLIINQNTLTNRGILWSALRAALMFILLLT